MVRLTERAYVACDDFDGTMVRCGEAVAVCRRCTRRSMAMGAWVVCFCDELRSPDVSRGCTVVSETAVSQCLRYGRTLACPACAVRLCLRLCVVYGRTEREPPAATVPSTQGALQTANSAAASRGHFPKAVTGRPQIVLASFEPLLGTLHHGIRSNLPTNCLDGPFLFCCSCSCWTRCDHCCSEATTHNPFKLSGHSDHLFFQAFL